MAHTGMYPAALGKWLAVGGLIGGIGGVIGSLFHIGVNYATQTRGQHPWILYLLPVLGLVIAGLYRVTRVGARTPTPSSNPYISGKTCRCCWCR